MSDKYLVGFSNGGCNVFNNLTISETGAIRIPFGPSNERPPTGLPGMIRYDDVNNIVEFYNNIGWSPISLPAPSITSCSPNYINFGISGGITNYPDSSFSLIYPDSSFSLIGNNFDLVSGVDVFVRGKNSGTIINPTTEIVNSSTNVVITFDSSGTKQLIDISNELPFSITLKNLTSGFQTEFLNAIIATNQGPIFTEPSTFSPSIFQDFAVQDGSASFTIAATDLSVPSNYPLKEWKFVSGTAGGFNNGGISDISINDASSATVKLPTGTLMNAAADNTQYTFSLQVKDASDATAIASYKLRLKHPVITNIEPSYIDLTVHGSNTFDVSVNGNYFINNTGIQFNNQSTGISAELTNGIVYNNSTSIVARGISAETGIYDISINNGSVYVNIPNISLTIVKSILTGYTTNMTTSVTYLDSGYTIDQQGSIVGGPVIGGWTIVAFTSGTNGNFSFNDYSGQVRFLLVGGGGPGGTDIGAGGGGGGILDQKQNFSSSYTYTMTVASSTASTVGGASGSIRGASTSISGTGLVAPLTAGGGGGGGNEISGDTSNMSGGQYLAGGGGGGARKQTGGAGNSYGGGRGGNGGTNTTGGAGSHTGCGGGGGGRYLNGSVLNGTDTGTQVKNGASGKQSNIDGNNHYYGGAGGGTSYNDGANGGNGGIGGGGGGSGSNTGGNGGSGGGSARNSGSNGGGGPGGAGGANTGGGGGGGTENEQRGGSGGSGIIIFRFPSYMYV